MSVYWLDTMDQRDKHYQHQDKAVEKKDVDMGGSDGDMERRLFGAAAEREGAVFMVDAMFLPLVTL